MRKLFVILSLVLISIGAQAQGIEFFHGTYEEALKKAKKQGKAGVFIDFYTKWCGPCRAMAKDVFPQKAVGDFYNKHFICMKVDAEEKEGKKLATKFQVQGFPTFKYIKPDGNVMKTGTSIGAGDAEKFIKLGRLALGIDTGKTWKWYEEEFAKGRSDTKFLIEYSEERFREKRMPETPDLTMKIIMSYPEDERYLNVHNLWRIANNAFPGNEFYNLLLTNRKYFEIIETNPHGMAMFFYNKITAAPANGKKPMEVYEILKKDFPFYAQQALEFYKADRLRFEDGEANAHIQSLFQYMSKYGVPTYIDRIIMISALQADEITPKQAEFIRGLNERSYKENSDHMMSVVIHLLMTYRMGLTEEAKNLAGKYITLAEQYQTSVKMKWFVDTIIKLSKGEEPTPLHFPKAIKKS